MNDCLYCLIYGEKDHPGQCLSINSKEGTREYEEYDREVDIEVEKVKSRWRKKLQKKENE